MSLKESTPLSTVNCSGSLKELSSCLYDMFQTMIIRTLEGGFSQKQVWTVIARYLLNQQEMCDKECEQQHEIHFHDSNDWFDPNEQNVLKQFWKTVNQKKANTFVQGVDMFIRDQKSNMITLLKRQAEDAKKLLEETIDEESRAFIEFLLGEAKEIELSFTFQCALICTMMEWQNHITKGGKNDDRISVNWFDMFFQFYVNDYDSVDESETESEMESETENEEEK